MQETHETSSISAGRIKQTAIAVIVIVSVIFVILQIGSAITTLNYQPTHPTSTNKTSATTPVTYNVTSITNKHLFGQFTGDGSIQQNIPITSLQLILRGAFTSTKPELASAIIEGPEGQTNAYKIGSQVFDQAELKEVFANRIVLSRNGELETLFFPKREVNISDNTATSVTGGFSLPEDIQSLVQDNLSVGEIQQAAQDLSSASLSPEQRKELIRKRLQDLRNRARQNK